MIKNLFKSKNQKIQNIKTWYILKLQKNLYF